MPIGVPRVPFRNPGERSQSWVDIYNRLYRERLVFLGQGVDSDIANQLIAVIIYLSSESETKDLFLFINSPGGWLIPGLGIYDTMQFVKPDIATVCLGLAASLGSFLLVAGAITKRLAFPHARVMIHQPASGYYQTQTAEFILEAEELLNVREAVTRVYAQRTGQPMWVVSEDLERDVFMSAEEAQAHGLVDRIIRIQ
uniref:ATP-dependent Clp protease proteolytic subunit n=3 Tax=Erythrostemon TaxID=508969 RepID=A0A8F5ZBX5_9FABA|nr:ATP-dependent Clp protease proteolytic subunit [Erythrostemon calycinus]QIS99478.1 ATP-dependent Clp protease proteolytic subunit [Erythrostemon calycinus]QXO89860.1 ATP-dependent Clp protease proteolytic subunit [Erythrostemon hughesii]QXO89943.1 ATP-dependent Clp protease proteolytic subunit [Erythrostemon pannosus]